jgi:hypothetical protein
MMESKKKNQFKKFGRVKKVIIKRMRIKFDRKKKLKMMNIYIISIKINSNKKIRTKFKRLKN